MWPDGEGPSHNGHGRASSGSEVVVIGDQVTSTAALQPTISNIHNSTKCHIGPKFVSISQTVHSNEVVKGRFLGLELVSPMKSRRLRCSVAVCVCWAFVVASGLGIYFLCIALFVPQTRIDIGLNETWYLRRPDWQALAPSSVYKMQFLRLPVKYVTFGHSAVNSCDNRRDCITEVRNIQRDHLERFGDISANYLVGGTGLVFEGRGANVIGAIIPGWNSKMISVMFLGDYRQSVLDDAQIENVRTLLKQLVNDNVLDPAYELYGYCQILTYNVSPGPNIMVKMHKFEHWRNENASKCLKRYFYLSCPRYLWDLVKNSTRAERVLCSIASLLVILCIFLIVYFTVIAKPNEEEPDTAPWNISREMWLAEPYSYTNEIDSVFEPLRLVIIQHSAGSECHRFASCASVLRNIQGYYIKVKHRDIPYNFQIGNDGRVYEGRGWRKEGAHTQFYNRCSVGIGFLGDYREELIGHSSVTALQQTRAHMLLNAGVQMGFLHPDYYVVGASDIQRDGTESPGSNLYRAIQQWAHFDHENRFRNKSCDEINAMFKRN
ncbi:peptidoglycan-recognition protein LF-like [Pectinophora gossypiella]|uniref:peptidoglycan-recognition protein LF-like n=1 Tax=Pectinophora gossypiella TaxID=13191 RepID=UPI00214E2361|nr:peptidoglycan-recognition protein LF-like [Pectinophora gossypiella]